MRKECVYYHCACVLRIDLLTGLIPCDDVMCTNDYNLLQFLILGLLLMYDFKKILPS